jgi:hypothetical protein
MLEMQMEDEEFRKEYEAIQPEIDVIRAIVMSGRGMGMKLKIEFVPKQKA